MKQVALILWLRNGKNYDSKEFITENVCLLKLLMDLCKNYEKFFSLLIVINSTSMEGRFRGNSCVTDMFF